jgi:ribulose kinase
MALMQLVPLPSFPQTPTSTGSDFKKGGNDKNVVVWLDHRPVEETKEINATNHSLLRCVGGQISIEMDTKALWLGDNMRKELFDQCEFYHLTDALKHLATGREMRRFCSAVCKQGNIRVGSRWWRRMLVGRVEDFLYRDCAEGNLVLYYYAMMEFIAQQIIEGMNEFGHVKSSQVTTNVVILLCSTKQVHHAKAAKFWTLSMEYCTAIACEDYVLSFPPPP